jgi:hypothetical protein
MVPTPFRSYVGTILRGGPVRRRPGVPESWPEEAEDGQMNASLPPMLRVDESVCAA